MSSNKSNVSTHLWHIRLGHPNFYIVDYFSKSGFISCSDKLMGLDSSLCVGCNLEKIHRLPFSLNNTCCDYLLITYTMIYKALHLFVSQLIFDIMQC